MEGFGQAYSLLVALSGVGLLYVAILFAHRRIPKQPAADSVHELRADFDGLAQVVEDLTLKHEESLGRSHAKVGHYRRKLRKLQEEEGLDPEDEDLGEVHPQVALPFPNQLPSRADLKHQARERLKQRA